MKTNITMRDIAEKLGVSSVTVSKALNDKEGVSADLKLKIKQVAAEMGYRYNTSARAMKDGRSYNIGVTIPERFTGMTQSFYLNIYQSLSKSLEQKGYYGILHILSSIDEKTLVPPRIYSEQKVDGLIILGQVSKEYIEMMQSVNIPVVFMDFYDEKTDMDAVITDNFYGAYDLTNYLISKGHKEIGYVGNLYATSSIQDRFLGYYKSLLEHRLERNDNYILNDRNEEGKFVDIQLPNQMPTAFVCNCDQVARLLINKLVLNGYQVPEDVSVVGFDNDAYATIGFPELTTVAVNVEEMARTAVQFMYEKVNDPSKKFGRVQVKGRIIYRDSVSSPTASPQKV
ncbi:substrate-binding domain-containing protein [Bacillus inaquosorum]|uniref:substrate-binding domain-containing protein n=1 Tax=Bacillus TaxID=1386 RepID=UPI0022821533|nr:MULTISPECIES: substrate-binding domain-containing protein [Bacillus subtilis group]MCY8928809.1 substrate-binding domain-containing protein [Bacillus subtilis]MCY9084946.1 substrate-binding domain-containing protein [Bacillus inaquosorum]